jgi:hypothetical protein
MTPKSEDLLFRTQNTCVTGSLECAGETVSPNDIAKDNALLFQEADLAVREEGDFVVYQIGRKTFSVLHVIEENLTAAELKHASLRQIAEESIHMDSLLHIIGSLNMDLDEVTARFSDIPSVRKKNAFITRQIPELKMGIDLTQTANKQKFAKAIFGITQVMEGTQFAKAWNWKKNLFATAFPKTWSASVKRISWITSISMPTGA